jgi:type I restriction-modification system DNA methylase subunit
MTQGSKLVKSYKINYEAIKELVSEYNRIKQSGEIRTYNEEKTKKDFILPLFEALGWNVYDKPNRGSSVSAEETISKKRVDYGFKTNGIPKFYLEAKSLKEEDIQNNGKYVLQAIDYAWMKSCSWAILTNFETIAVYNADWKSPYYNGNLFFVLHPTDFLNNKRLTLLSKQAFENNELDKQALDVGKKQFKNHIDKQLLEDMIHFREILSKDIMKNNQDKHLSQEDLDESVQRILDRLIFIRNAEDRELEENKLLSNVRQWSAKGKGELIKEISKVYSYYDDKYNSKLFSKHLCDDLYTDNEVMQEVIEGLNHSKDNSYRYDFSVIESDVLGNIYEQYLGNVLKTTPKRAKLESSKVHRKEQGIYYTPSYIVDYMVQNTVGEYIKTHTPEEIKHVKILDPACGSGSFLIRAYKELENYWKQTTDFAQTRLDSEEFYPKKVEILKNNIFGVDLDPKAVEIAQLNLLLQISESKQRLPILQTNIKVGNSLIDNPTISKRAFRWEEEFPEITKNGGFDIIIGNPPWVFTRGEHFTEEEKSYFTKKIKEMGINQTNKGKNIQSGKLNLYSLFLVGALKLLKQSGSLGFILPNNILRTTTYDTVRKYILENSSIKRVVDLSSGVFDNVTASSVIIFLKAEINQIIRNDNTVEVIYNIKNLNSGSYEINRILQSAFLSNTSYTFDILINEEEKALLSKVESEGRPLGEISKYIIEGIVCSLERDVKDSMINSNYKKFLIGKDIGRFEIIFRNRYVNYDRKILHRARPEEVFLSKKIIIQRISGGNFPLKGTIDYDSYYTFASINNIVLKSEFNNYYEYILGLLNSKLFNWYYAKKFTNKSTLTVNVSKTFLEKLPINLENENNKLVIEKNVTKAIELTKIIGQHSYTTDRDLRLQNELMPVIREIDNLVFNTYKLTPKEIEIINSFFDQNKQEQQS